MKNVNKGGRLLTYLLFASLLIWSCTGQDAPEPDPQPDPTPAATAKTVLQLNWDQPNGTYSQPMALKDFGNVVDWNAARATIVDNQLRVILLKDLLSGSGGMVAKMGMEAGSEYKIAYDLKFDKDFEWGTGGKVGFGLRIGDGNTGCDRADDGNGGSARLMWYTDSKGITRFKPYLYYKDMPGTCGYNLVATSGYPELGSIEKDKWYRISIYVKSNTGSNKDGWVQFSVDGNLILNQVIRWTTNDSKRLINRLSLDTFRGGSTADWTTRTDGYIYLDNLVVEKLQ